MKGYGKKASAARKDQVSGWEKWITGFLFGLLTAIAIVAIVVNWQEPMPRHSEEPERFYSEIPGIDLGTVAGDRRAAFLEQLNRDRCTCSCKMTLAHCRNHHSSCKTSLKLSRETAEAFKVNLPR